MDEQFKRAMEKAGANELPNHKNMDDLFEAGARWAYTERQKEIDELKGKLALIQKKVDAQAEDEGLWFYAETGPESYVQRELRELHRVIERPMIKLTEKESE